MISKRKITRTYGEKLKIIKYAESHSGMMRKDIAERFDISPKTLSDILKVKHKEKIKAACTTCSDSSVPRTTKRRRASTHPKVEKALLVWFRQKAAKPDIRGASTCTMMRQQANRFRLQLTPESDRTISAAWIERFKKRHGFVRSGASGSVDVQAVQENLAERLQTYDADDIYNADETGLFWLLLPDNALGFNGYATEQPQPMITVLVASNVTGTDKLPLFVIGKSQKPRAFNNVKVPVEYSANKKAWMTSALFEIWLHKLDRKMQLEDRKIAVVIDNCSAHPHVNLSNVNLIFLPTNTNYAQPMDSGIIRNLKYFYRFILATRRIDAFESNEAFSWNILDAVIALKTAWKQVTQETIVSCFKKAGFAKEDSMTVVRKDEPTPETEFQNLWSRLREVYGGSVLQQNHGSYVAIDDKADATALMTDEEIVQAVRDLGEGDSDAEENVKDEIPVTKLAEAHAALRTLRHYGLTRGSTEIEDLTDKLETVLMKENTTDWQK